MGGQADIILGIFIVCSAFSSYRSGLWAEVFRLTAYLCSGVLGYWLAPCFQPIFLSRVGYEAAATTIAAIAASIVAWICLRMCILPYAGLAKHSKFRQIDAYAGAMYGLGRSFLFTASVSVMLAVAAPVVVAQSRLLSTGYEGVREVVPFLPEISALVGKNADKDIIDWKKSMLEYMKQTDIPTENGKLNLLDWVSGFLAAEISKSSEEPLAAEDARSILEMRLEGKSDREIVLDQIRKKKARGELKI